MTSEPKKPPQTREEWAREFDAELERIFLEVIDARVGTPFTKPTSE